MATSSSSSSRPSKADHRISVVELVKSATFSLSAPEFEDVIEQVRQLRASALLPESMQVEAASSSSGSSSEGGAEQPHRARARLPYQRLPTPFHLKPLSAPVVRTTSADPAKRSSQLKDLTVFHSIAALSIESDLHQQSAAGGDKAWGCEFPAADSASGASAFGNNASIWGLLDGAGGSSVASFVRDNFVQCFEDTALQASLGEATIQFAREFQDSQLLTQEDQAAASVSERSFLCRVKAVFFSTFMQLNNQLRLLEGSSEAAVQHAVRNESAVATVAFLNTSPSGIRSCFVAHVGNIQAVLCHGSDCDADLLTAKHTPADLEERSRAEKAGLHIYKNKFCGSPDGLEVTRAFGHFKTPGGFSAEPGISVFTVQEGKFLILATDEVWAHLNAGQAQALVYDHLEKVGNKKTAAKALVTEARRLGGEHAAVLDASAMIRFF